MKKKETVTDESVARFRIPTAPRPPLGLRAGPSRSAPPGRALATSARPRQAKRRAGGRRGTLEDAFRVFDVDKSETISADEFAKGCAPFLQGVEEQTIRALFHTAFDIDGSGAIELDEFISVLLEEKPSRSTRNGVDKGMAANRSSQLTSPSRARTKFRTHAEQGAASRPSRSRERQRSANKAKASTARRAVTPFFSGARPELGPNGSKIGAKTGGAANNGGALRPHKSGKGRPRRALSRSFGSGSWSVAGQQAYSLSLE